MKYIIVRGNPVDGLSFIGPFDTASEAIEGAQGLDAITDDWWITELNAPSAAS